MTRTGIGSAQELCPYAFRAGAGNMLDLCQTRFLIDRLYDPRKFLETIHDRLNLGVC